MSDSTQTPCALCGRVHLYGKSHEDLERMGLRPLSGESLIESLFGQLFSASGGLDLENSPQLHKQLREELYPNGNAPSGLRVLALDASLRYHEAELSKARKSFEQQLTILGEQAESKRLQTDNDREFDATLKILEGAFELHALPSLNNIVKRHNACLNDLEKSVSEETRKALGLQDLPKAVAVEKALNDPQSSYRKAFDAGVAKARQAFAEAKARDARTAAVAKVQAAAANKGAKADDAGSKAYDETLSKTLEALAAGKIPK